MSQSLYTGINIQWPISELILKGHKTIETRTYPLPSKYINVPLVLVETPGAKGSFKSRVVALITFSDSFQYESKEKFREDFVKHKVEVGSLWDWKEKSKWGWVIKEVKPIKAPQAKLSHGIIFRSNIQI